MKVTIISHFNLSKLSRDEKVLTILGEMIFSIWKDLNVQGTYSKFGDFTIRVFVILKEIC